MGFCAVCLRRLGVGALSRAIGAVRLGDGGGYVLGCDSDLDQLRDLRGGESRGAGRVSTCSVAEGVGAAEHRAREVDAPHGHAHCSAKLVTFI